MKKDTQIDQAECDAQLAALHGNERIQDPEVCRNTCQRIIEEYGDELKSLLRKLISNQDERDEVFQMVSQTLISALPGYKGNGLRAWLLTIVKSRVADFYRAKNAHKKRGIEVVRLDTDMEQALPGKGNSGPNSKLEIARAVMTSEPAAGPSPSLCYRMGQQMRDCITPEQRQIMKLHYREGLTYAEIARRLGLSEAAVARRCQRAIDKIKHQWKAHTA